MKKMKNKVTLFFVCFIVLALFTSCEMVLRDKAGRQLPNGYVLSQSEEDALFAFAMEKGYIAPSSRSFSDYTAGPATATVDEMVASLKEEFGEAAENYYWTEDITNQCSISVNGNEVVSAKCNNSRSQSMIEYIPFELEEQFTNYDARLKQKFIRYSGLWWVYYRFITEPLIRENSNLIYNNYETFLVNKISINYTDDVNNINYEKVFPPFYYDYTSFEEELQLINDGMTVVREVEIKSKSKNGWLPKINSIITTVQYSHPAIRGGTVTITSSYAEK